MSDKHSRTAASWRVPGRIEVLGKHTDYAGGRVLVGAVDRGVQAHARRITGAPGTLSATTSVSHEPVRLHAGQDCALPPGHWGRYVQTVLDRLTANFGSLPAVHIEVESDLPPASGMSSSSALICACALALADVAGLQESELWSRNIPDRLSMAGYLAGVEAGRPWRELLGAEGVGTQGGSEDHTGMLCGDADTLLLAQFDPMEVVRTVRFPSEWAFVVGVTGVLAEKTGAALEDYNRGPLTLRSVLARWNEHTGRSDTSLAAAVRFLIGDATGEAAAKDPALEDLLRLTEAGYERGRVEQFLTESIALVPAGADAVAAGDGEAFGQIARLSHELADRGLRNQVPATNAMVDVARDMGAMAASAFGAGWGGSVYALVPAADAQDFAAQWLQAYRTTAEGNDEIITGIAPSTIVTRPGRSAQALS